MKQLGFLINISKCVGCKTCQFACKNENNLLDHTRRQVLKIHSEHNTFESLSIACNHCENPACMHICPNHCFIKKRNGIVIFDPTNCNSCKKCVSACPFGAIYVHPQTNKVDKCDLCSERLKKDLLPACVSTCVTGAIQLIDILAPENKDFVRVAPGFEMKRITNPSIRFYPTTEEAICFWMNEEEEEESGKR